MFSRLCFSLPRGKNGTIASLAYFSSSGFSGSGSSSWSRVAHKIQVTNEKAEKAPKYMDKVAEKIEDPQATILQLQDEVQEEMAAALGRTGYKLLDALKQLEEAQAELNEHLAESKGKENESQLAEFVNKYNSCREAAVSARWELLIHRQAVGFRFQNQKYVETKYPIPPRFKL